MTKIKTCPSGKRMFSSRRYAKEAKKSMLKQNKHAVVYHCDKCDHWHLANKRRRKTLKWLLRDDYGKNIFNAELLEI